MVLGLCVRLLSVVNIEHHGPCRHVCDMSSAVGISAEASAARGRLVYCDRKCMTLFKVCFYIFFIKRLFILLDVFVPFIYFVFCL